MKNRKTTMKVGMWTALGGLGAVVTVVALALLGRPHRGVSGIRVDGVRIVEHRDGSSVLAWTGANESGKSCRYAARLEGSAGRDLPRGGFTATTALASPHAIAWLRIECGEESIQIPWDMSYVELPGTDHAPAGNRGRVEVARLELKTTEARRIAASVIREELLGQDRVTRVGNVALHSFGVGSDEESIWLRLAATAEADIRWTPCNRVEIDSYIRWARHDLEPQRADVRVDLRDTWRSTRWLCRLTKAVASRKIKKTQEDVGNALLRPVGHAVWQWLLGDGDDSSKVAGRIREFTKEGDLRVSALAREGRIRVRVTAAREWLGRGAAELVSAAPMENGQAAAGAVSYTLANRLLGVLSATELRDLGLSGETGGVVGDAVAIVERVTSRLATEMERRLGRGARIEVADDLGFRLPLAVAPDGEHGLHVYLKGADVVTADGGAARYSLWAHARTRLACLAARQDQYDRDAQTRASHMRRGVTVTASSDGRSASAQLAAGTSMVLRGEQAGLKNPDPLRSLRTQVARYCVVRTPMQIGRGLAIDALWNDPASNAVLVSVRGAGGR